ncbi:flagellar protein FlhE [Halomonas koreensis]|uniref:Flagellar protein FlhE n=1 Tax=Halomonas koreensis TaxID=245385 RepID=A0ABU1G1S7_9GAMM|nr:flagellar protein FlhE [Halomonas koreensis]MDR5866894.1 flagellar protein FlhE [Halomonas koreensis]
MRRGAMAGAALLGWLLAAPASASGSWAAEAPGVRAAVAGRETPSRALTPPPAAAGGRVVEVRWRYRVPAGAALRARLCHPAGCVTLPARRGRTRALAGLPAGEALRFRFAPDGAGPVRVQGLQVIVNYR